MLVLRRRPGEKIRIGDNVVITFLGIRGGDARLGIEAPPEVEIMRTELDRHSEKEGRNKPTCNQSNESWQSSDVSKRGRK